MGLIQGKGSDLVWYSTPPETLAELLAKEEFPARIWEPACGDGGLAKALEKAGYVVLATDLFDYGYGYPGVDFLEANQVKFDRPYGIITTPPYGLLQEFIAQALSIPGIHKVAYFLKASHMNNIEIQPSRVHRLENKVVVDPLLSPQPEYIWAIWDKTEIKEAQVNNEI